MSSILILFAHPQLQSSRVHRRLVARVPDLPGVTFHDLYEEYPQLDIDVEREQALAESHDLLLFQHPFYWYSVPPILKQWQDLVLEHGWAYGSKGKALVGKRALNVVSTGGTESAYQPGGYNRFTVRQLLAPVEQTARLCGMTWLPPYVIHGTHGLSPADIDEEAGRFARLVRGLHDDTLELGRFLDADTLNGVLEAAA